jgi:uncharacterized Zn finger protein (UPF0148 family)
MANCPNCGTKLNETNFARLFCPNCGLVADDSIADKEDKAERDRGYIG